MSRAIADYALLSDCRGAALVGRDGSVDWWPAPRFDSPSVFSRILDPKAGHFAVRPTSAFETSRRYRSDSLVLETTMATDAGSVRVTDALAFGPGARGHEIGCDVPPALVRLVQAVEGEVELEAELVPRPEYGLAVPRLFARDSDVIESVGGLERVVLHTDTPLEVEGAKALGTFILGEGHDASFALHRLSSMNGRGTPAPLDVAATLDDTTAAWRSWAELHDDYDGAHPEAVRFSALVLQGLTHQPTGAVVAAPTTSLPEIAGGEENYDYRYAWLRDASLIARALQIASCTEESH